MLSKSRKPVLPILTNYALFNSPKINPKNRGLQKTVQTAPEGGSPSQCRAQCGRPRTGGAAACPFCNISEVHQKSERGSGIPGLLSSFFLKGRSTLGGVWTEGKQNRPLSKSAPTCNLNNVFIYPSADIQFISGRRRPLNAGANPLSLQFVIWPASEHRLRVCLSPPLSV